MISGTAKKGLDCQKHVFDYLESLVEEIGMTKIIQPYVFPYSGLVTEDKGVTGMVIIAESHISVHTFSEKNYVFLDVFSCKDFNTQKAIDFSVDWFQIDEGYEVEVVNRG